MMTDKPTYQELESQIAELQKKNEILRLNSPIKSDEKGSQADLSPSDSHTLMGYIVENSRTAIAVHDKDLNYIYVNQRYLDIYKVKEKTIIGKHLYKIFPDIPQKWKDVHQKALKGMSSSVDEDKFSLEDGSVDWANWECRPWFMTDSSIGGITISSELITERILAKEAVLAREKQLRFITDNTPVKIAHCDHKQIYKFVNQPYADMLGLEMVDIVGKRSSDVCGEELYSKAKPHIETVLTGQKTSFDFLLPRDPDNPRTMLVNFEPEFDESGRVIGFVSGITDITKIIQIEEKTLQLSAAIEQSPNSIVITNLNGNIEYVNPYFSQLTGYTFEEAIGKNPRILQSGEMLPEHYKELWETIMNGHTWKGVFHNKDKHGELYWESATISGIKNDKGEIVSYLAIKEDVTEQKKLAEDLAESEERFRHFFNDLGDAVFVTKIGGTDSSKILEVNPAAEKQTGYTREELLKMNLVHDLSVEGSSESPLDEWNQSLKKGQKVLSLEKKRKKNGTEYWTEVVITPIDFRGEKVSLSINHDITERKLSEEKLMQLNNELKELNATRDKLFSIIAHDLRSPFNSILGFSKLLIKNVNNYETEKSEKYLNLINSLAKDTLVLLDNLLNWTKLQTGRINSIPEKLFLSSIIQDVIDISNPNANIKNISLNFTQSDDIEIYTDENMLRTVLRNLISNAIKFSSQGGKIHVFAILKQKEVEISISDNGVGMDKETLEKLFNISAKITTAGTAGEKGSGLGLVLCKEFVEKLGGNIWVESKKGKGSDFKFSLPLNKKTIT